MSLGRRNLFNEFIHSSRTVIYIHKNTSTTDQISKIEIKNEGKFHSFFYNARSIHDFLCKEAKEKKIDLNLVVSRKNSSESGFFVEIHENCPAALTWLKKKFAVQMKYYPSHHETPKKNEIEKICCAPRRK